MSDLRWIEVDEATYATLRTARDIREHKPYTLEQHLAELAGGWPGSDGASGGAPDTVWFLRIGLTTTEFRPDLSAWKHDAGCRAARRLLACGAITDAEFDELLQILNRDFFNDLLDQIEQAAWVMRGLRRRRALKYYEGVRIGAGRAVRNAMKSEVYPRLALRSGA